MDKKWSSLSDDKLKAFQVDEKIESLLDQHFQDKDERAAFL